MNWQRKRVLVTGGASFIGSHLCEELIRRGAIVRVVDNLSSGRLENLENAKRQGEIEFFNADLLDSNVAAKATDKIEVVFHLAADHGGRGYVDLHQAACSSNLALDGMLFLACKKAGVEKIVYASSGCVYPNFLQKNPKEVLYLKEAMSGPPYDSDNLYGWAKLMGEMTLQAYAKDFGMKTASCRFFTVYGERGIENHAVIAMIARAFIRQDPFLIWGDGNQVRNWTYVLDIVEGMILSAEKIDDGSAVNLGTMERVRVIDAAKEIVQLADYSPKFKFLTDMPTGPLNRVADNSFAKSKLGWEPKVKFSHGLKKTLAWYFSTKKREQVASYLDRMLTER